MDSDGINLSIAIVSSPLGNIELCSSEGFLTRLKFTEQPSSGTLPEPLKQIKDQLDDYFRGKRKNFEIPILPEGTEFQKRVWEIVYEIPFGTTISYGEIAGRLGLKNGARAVGLANGANPLAIIIPCHRVIGSDGRLTGYAGGLWRKEWLLKMEMASSLNSLGGLFG